MSESRSESRSFTALELARAILADGEMDLAMGNAQENVRLLCQEIVNHSEIKESKADLELANIANAERFNRERFRDDTEFADWAQSRCRYILKNAAPQVAAPVRGSEITPLQAEYADRQEFIKDAQDAARYRWLRDYPHTDGWSGIPRYEVSVCVRGMGTVLRGAKLDEHVDMEMSKPRIEQEVK